MKGDSAVLDRAELRPCRRRRCLVACTRAAYVQYAPLHGRCVWEVEASGARGDLHNIKLTTPEDLLAEAFLALRRDAAE